MRHKEGEGCVASARAVSAQTIGFVGNEAAPDGHPRPAGASTVTSRPKRPIPAHTRPDLGAA
jgi:hypothetical protein